MTDHPRLILQDSPYDVDTAAESIDWAAANGWDAIAIKTVEGAHRITNVGDRQPIDVAAMVALAHEKGIKLLTWSVPEYVADDGFLRQQAELIAADANASDGHLLDFEDGLEFWGYLRPVGAAANLMQRIRALAPDAWLLLNPDPREGHMRGIRAEEILPYVDGLSGQWYFGSTFQQSADRVVNEAINSPYWSVAPQYPDLPLGEPDEGLAGAAARFAAAGAVGFVGWHYGNARASTAGVLRAALGSDQPAPPPTPDKPTLEPLVKDSVYSELEMSWRSDQRLRYLLKDPDSVADLDGRSAAMDRIKARYDITP